MLLNCGLQDWSFISLLIGLLALFISWKSLQTARITIINDIALQKANALNIHYLAGQYNDKGDDVMFTDKESVSYIFTTIHTFGESIKLLDYWYLLIKKDKIIQLFVINLHSSLRLKIDEINKSSEARESITQEFRGADLESITNQINYSLNLLLTYKV